MAPSNSFDGVTVKGPARVGVRGLNRTLRALSRAGADAQDMKDLMHALGEMVVSAAQVPTLSGRLAGTLRAGRGKTKAVIRAGGARAPYAGVIHYGNPAHAIASHPFLVDALRRERTNVLTAFDAGIADLLKKNDLT